MQDLIFPTASSIAVFLNGVHVDLAYSINFRHSVPKIPIYGYNDYEFKKVVKGKSIVQGVLVCNFIYPGYLSAILNARQAAYSPKLYNYSILENSPSVQNQFKDTIERKLSTELPPNTDQASREARANFIASLISATDPLQKAKTKEALVNFMTPKSSQFDFPQSSIVSNPLDIVTTTEDGNQLDVYYQDPEYASYFCRFTNVEFTETSQQMSQAGAEGSSEPLYLIHQFIAKSKEIRQVT